MQAGVSAVVRLATVIQNADSPLRCESRYSALRIRVALAASGPFGRSIYKNGGPRRLLRASHGKNVGWRSATRGSAQRLFTLHEVDSGSSQRQATSVPPCALQAANTRPGLALFDVRLSLTCQSQYPSQHPCLYLMRRYYSCATDFAALSCPTSPAIPVPAETDSFLLAAPSFPVPD